MGVTVTVYCGAGAGTDGRRGKGEDFRGDRGVLDCRQYRRREAPRNVRSEPDLKTYGCVHRGRKREVECRDITYLNTSIEIQADGGHPTPEIKVASRAVGDTSTSMLHQLDFILSKVACMGEDGVVPQ